MKFPASYIEILKTMPEEISYDIGGIKLFPVAELEQAQVGYSLGPDGKSLCGDNDGDWRSSWIVIGHETACGDPLFIDTNDTALPVLTAIHGEGAWEPRPVAISIKAFAQCLEVFSHISSNRRNPVELENNPLSEGERSAFLHRIAELNERKFQPEFWNVLSQTS